MSQLLSVCVLAVFSTTVFASTPDLNQPSVQCVDTVTNEVVKKAETTSAAATTTTEQVKVVKKVRKFRKAAPVKLDLPELAVTGRSYLNHSGSAVVVVPTAQAGYVSGVNAAGEIVTYKTSEISSTTTITPNRKVTSDWAVTGLTKSTKSGQQVMVVPVAKPGYISAVTESGKIVMFQAPAKSTAAVATTTTTVTSNRKLVAASISTAAAPKTVVTKTTTVTTTAAPTITEQEMQAAAVAPPVEAVEPVEVTASPVEAVEPTEETQQVVTVVEPRYKARAKDSYVMGVLGMQSTNASNVNSGIGINGAFGKYVLENIMIEAGLGFSKYSADVRNFTFVNQTDNFDINQYAAHVAAKYQFNNLSLARLVPVAGAILSYTYRQYGITNSQTNLNGGTGNSNAVDAGLVAGLDYQLSDAYAIGFDLKYMTNLSNNVNATYTNPTLGYVGSPVEQFQYYLAGLSMRMDF